MRAIILTTTFLSFIFLGCQGNDGADGAAGEPGAPGEPGTDGKDGEDGKDGVDRFAPSHVLQGGCKTCHPDRHEQWKKSGHANAMMRAKDAKPQDPPADYAYPDNPPAGYTWPEVTYIIGGYSHGAAFTDAKGYVITGEATAYLTRSKTWVDYATTEAPGTMPADCGACHSTFYRAYDGHEMRDRQLDLEGIEGTWLEEGVTCEECHGKGGGHASAQGYEWIRIDRTVTLCGQCHAQEPLDQIAASDGLIAAVQQVNELAATKMRLVECVDCHDPHRSTLTDLEAITSRCETCHYKQAQRHKVAPHEVSHTCVDCHMPRAVRSLVNSEPAPQGGEIKSHLFRINPDVSAEQVSADGKTIEPYLTLTTVCRRCHTDPMTRTDAELAAAAAGYHD